MKTKKVSIYAELIKERANNIMISTKVIDTDGLHKEDIRAIKHELDTIMRYLQEIEQELDSIK